MQVGPSDRRNSDLFCLNNYKTATGFCIQYEYRNNTEFPYQMD